MFRTIVTLSALTAVLACPQHDYSIHNNVLGKRATESKDWTYEASYNWGMINKNYTLCQTGTQQAPIPLLLTQGLSMNHRPTFSYSTPVAGNIYNWGYGPAFSVNTNSTPITSAPSMTWDDKTVYLKGWHIHSPADHSVQGDRSKSELHLVHSDAEGHEKAVVAIRVDPGNTNSPFFNQFEQPSSTITTMPNFDETTTIPTTLDMAQVLSEVANFSEFWTYEGSLTSPPCTEGIRWFVARNVLFVGVDQMREVLRVSTYSARVEQEVWQHGINV